MTGRPRQTGTVSTDHIPGAARKRQSVRMATTTPQLPSGSRHHDLLRRPLERFSFDVRIVILRFCRAHTRKRTFHALASDASCTAKAKRSSYRRTSLHRPLYMVNCVGQHRPIRCDWPERVFIGCNRRRLIWSNNTN